MHGLYTYRGKGETLLSKLNILKKHVEQKKIVVSIRIIIGN
jgi:hypothetical protein